MKLYKDIKKMHTIYTINLSLFFCQPYIICVKDTLFYDQYAHAFMRTTTLLIFNYRLNCNLDTE